MHVGNQGLLVVGTMLIVPLEKPFEAIAKSSAPLSKRRRKLSQSNSACYGEYEKIGCQRSDDLKKSATPYLCQVDVDQVFSLTLVDVLSLRVSIFQYQLTSLSFMFKAEA
jgi:hypothetical protein